MTEGTNGHNRQSPLDRAEQIIRALAARQHLIDDEFVRLDRALRRLTEGRHGSDESSGEK